MKLSLIIGSFCLLLLWGCSSTLTRARLYSGSVVRVSSGQTVEVMLTGSNELVKVRIIGIDAPDWRQTPWGPTAKAKLSALVMNQRVEIEADNLERDRYGRVRGHLWQGQTLVSQELVRTGCVLANDRAAHSYSKLLMESQEYARLLGHGIWNPQQAMRQTPYQFRLNSQSTKP